MQNSVCEILPLELSFAERAISSASRMGASYADVRVEFARGESILVKDGKVERVKSVEQCGLGLRVLLKTWGFASTTDLNRDSVNKAVKSALGMARATKKFSKIELSKIRVENAEVIVKVKTDPLDVPLGEKVKLCLESDGLAQVDRFIRRTSAWLATEASEKAFMSSEGANVVFRNTLTYGGVFALSKRGGVVEYIDELAGGSGGFEIVKRFNMPARAAEVGRRASALAASKPVSKRKAPVVLDQDFVALLCHEIIGHPSEADRVLGREAAWAGKAWWAGKIGERVGSKLLNATDDPRVSGALGYYEYDDEGVRARRKELIRAGALIEHMHSRETAAEFGVEPNGNMRAQSFEYLPLIRMSNTFIEPGDSKREEVFDISDGFYLKGAKVPSIDSRRYNFQLSAKEAFLVKRGGLTGPFRGASLRGTAPEFFNSIDAVADDFEMRPIPNCGKGDPMQTLHVGNGGPHIRGIGFVAGVR